MKGYGQGWRAGFRQSKALTERQTRERSTNFTSPNMSCEVTASLGYLPFAPRRARRLDWVETTHQPVAAFGKRTFNVGFPAVSPKSCRSPPDPDRASGLPPGPSHSNDMAFLKSPEKVVHVQQVMQPSCEPSRNRVYSRPLGERNAWSGSQSDGETQ